MAKLEKQIEAEMRRRIDKLGGLFLKWNSPGNDGVPDRIAIFPNGSVWFVELKTVEGVIRPLQLYWNDKLLMMGCNAVIIRGQEEMLDWCVARSIEMERWQSKGGDAQ